MSTFVSIDRHQLPKSTLCTQINANSNKPRTFISRRIKHFSNYPLQKSEDDYPFRFEIETSFAFITVLFVLFIYFLLECNPYNPVNYDYVGEDFVEPCNASISVESLIHLKERTEKLQQELSSLNIALDFHLHHNHSFDPYNDDSVTRHANIRSRYLTQSKILEEQYNIYLHCYRKNVIKYYKSLYFQNGIFTIFYLIIVGIFMYSASYYIQNTDKNGLTEYQLMIHKRNSFLVDVAIILNSFCGIGGMVMFFFPVIDESYINEFPS